MMDVTIKEVKLDQALLERLLALSGDWERENSCYGYRKNSRDFIEGNRIFLAEARGEIAGYLLGHREHAEATTSIYTAGTAYFEIEELYVKPEYRSRGIGKALFQFVETAVADEVEMLMLSTATKNFRAILHFYIDELGMEFWSARLFKKIG